MLNQKKIIKTILEATEKEYADVGDPDAMDNTAKAEPDKQLDWIVWRYVNDYIYRWFQGKVGQPDVLPDLSIGVITFDLNHKDNMEQDVLQALGEYEDHILQQYLDKKRVYQLRHNFQANIYASLKRLEKQGLLHSIEGRGLRGRVSLVWEPVGILDDSGHINRDWKPSYV